MRNIEELINNVKKYNNAIIQEKLKSKKNTVAYVTINDKPRVLKWFVPGFKKQMINEYKILNLASSKLNIPKIFDFDDENNVLCMNFIIGENLSDIINSEDTSYSEKQRLIILLAKWFLEFHNFFKKNNEFIIRGDSNLRNFIFTDKIWGVDFEEARIGNPVEDIAGLCSSILSSDPMFTKEKYELCRKFINAYIGKVPGRILKINDEISYALLEKIQWREQDEGILRKHSKKIREKVIF
jgi:tRNA A-37 threonylcarbamoyl transferase component Bud32